MTELQYTAFERLAMQRPVQRVAYLTECCRGRVVLDLGCYDETALSKVGSGNWLHEELASVARSTLGIDASSALPEGGLRTGPSSTIIRGDVTRLESLVPPGFAPDVVVAGELIEHLQDALSFLCQIKTLFDGREFLASTPNATSLSSVVLACGAREPSHQDHLQIYSYKTLTTLCRRANFSDWTIIPYHASYPEMVLRNTGLRRTLARAAESAAAIAETLFPFLSFGLILHVRRI